MPADRKDIRPHTNCAGASKYTGEQSHDKARTGVEHLRPAVCRAGQLRESSGLSPTILKSRQIQWAAGLPVLSTLRTVENDPSEEVLRERFKAMVHPGRNKQCIACREWVHHGAIAKRSVPALNDI